MASLGDLIVKVGAEVDGFVSAMESVAQKMDRVASRVEKKLDAMNGAMGRLAIGGAALTASIAVPLEEIARQAVETSAAFEQTSVAFTTLMGSAAKADAMLKDLYQFAATTPFEIQGVLKGSRQLTAIGVASKDIIPMMRTLGDAAAGLGMNQEGLERLIYHFGQLKAEGSIDKLIIRELGQAGINAGQMLADGLGKTVPEVLKMVHEKAIDANTAIRLLMEGMDKRFGGMMIAQMGTLNGQLSNLKDNVTFTMNEIGKVLLPTGKALIDLASRFTNFAKSAAESFGKLSLPVKAFIIAAAGILPAVGTALTLIGGLGLAVTSLAIGIAPIAAILGITSGGFTALALAVGVAVAEWVAMGVWVYKEWPIIKAVVTTVWDDVQEAWSAAWDSVKGFLIGTWASISETAGKVWGAMKSVVVGTWSGIAGTAQLIWGSVGGVIMKVVDGAVGYAQKAWGFIKSMVGEAGKLLASIPGIGHIGEDISRAVESAKAHQDLLENLHRAGNRGAKGDAPPQLGIHIPDGHEKKHKAAKVHAEKAAKPEKLFEADEVLLDSKKSILRWQESFQRLTSEFGKDHEKMREAGLKTIEILVPAMERLKGPIATAIKLNERLADAYEFLGVESTKSLQRQASEARKAYDLILGTGIATEDQLREAWIRQEEARQKATEGSGGEVSRKQKITLNMEKQKADGKDDGLTDNLGKNGFVAFNQSFNAGIQNMLNGTRTFRQAWGEMVQNMYQSFTAAIANQITKWAAMKVQQLAIHMFTNKAIVASDAATAHTSWLIQLGHHLKIILMHAKQAAVKAWNAAMTLPIPFNFVAAPLAAAASFAGAMAFGAVSAERGADLPNYNTMGVLHPREMVLPREQADVIRGLAKNGEKGGSSGGDIHFHGDMIHNAAKSENFTESQWIEMGKRAFRNRPGLRLATT